MRKLLLIKLGGSLITDKGRDFTARPEVIHRLAAEIKSAQTDYSHHIILAHGSGSFAHTFAHQYQTQSGITDDQGLTGLSLVADAAIQINRIVIKILLEAQLRAISFAPASLFVAKSGKLHQANTTPVFQALKIGMLPVLYGDVILDMDRGSSIFSSETTLGILAQHARRDYRDIRIIYCGNTDGVYDPDGQTIPLITPTIFEKIRQYLGGSDKKDVTGGMMHKVQESLILARLGITTQIISGTRPDALKRAILGQQTAGTLIQPD
jgi:isopentenyl phosphate kinase